MDNILIQIDQHNYIHINILIFEKKESIISTNTYSSFLTIFTAQKTKTKFEMLRHAYLDKKVGYISLKF